MIFFPISTNIPSFGYWKLLALAVAIAAASSAWKAHGQEAHSAQWYAEHDAERAEMAAQCANHPGPARRSDDCAAVWEANIIVTIAEAEKHVDMTSPNEPAYWQKRPAEQQKLVKRCEKMSPEQQVLFFCAAARKT